MRYDLWVRPLDGPSRGQELRGKGVSNLIEIGKQPRDGGILLPIRSLAPVHVTVQLKDGHAIATPVGTLPVRLAPHANVDWNRVDPLTQPAWWNPGGVLYLGRPGSGVALELVRVEALGEWQGRDAVSPDKPTRIIPPRLPIYLVGCGVIGVTMAMGVSLAVVIVAMWEPAEVLPGEGPVTYEFAEPESSEILDDTWHDHQGLERAWALLQVQPSMDVASEHRDVSARRPREAWDDTAFRHFVASTERHASSKAFYKRVDTVKDSWLDVRNQVVEQGLPEVLTAIPMTESRYRPRLQSEVCARGFWQLMPETAIRVGVPVSDCKIAKADGSFGSFTPEEQAPPRRPVYLQRDGDVLSCRIKNNSCTVDDRSNLNRSTEGALRSLSEAWTDPTLQASGAGVMMTVLSHNAGLDDGRYGTPRSTNVLRAYKGWKDDQSPDHWHRFYGANLACPGKENMSRLDVCGDSKLAAQTQHYGYTVFAQYLIAMCYLGQNYPDDVPDWAERAADEDGVCRRFRIPGRQEL